MDPIFDEQVCYALYSTANVVAQIYKNVMNSTSSNLTAICHSDGLVAKRSHFGNTTSIMCRMSKSTMTPLLKRLELLAYYFA